MDSILSKVGASGIDGAVHSAACTRTVGVPVLAVQSVAPLGFAWHAITISVHLRVRAVSNEVRGLGARLHLRAHCAPITGIAGRWRRQLYRCVCANDFRRRDPLRVLGIAVYTNACDNHKRQRTTKLATLRALPIARGGRPPCGSPARSHYANGALLSVKTSFNFERDQLIELRSHAIPWKRGYVDKEVARSFSRRDKAKAPVVVPLGKSAMSTHESALTPRISAALPTHPENQFIHIAFAACVCSAMAYRCPKGWRPRLTCQAVGSTETAKTLE